jgi:hypothetical protein
MVNVLVQSVTSNRIYDFSGQVTLATLLGLSEAIQRIPDVADPCERPSAANTLSHVNSAVIGR